MYDQFLARLGLDIDEYGFADLADDVAAVVAAARVTGANATLVDVLADAHAPEVVRARAYGRVAMHLSRHFGEPRATEALVGSAS